MGKPIQVAVPANEPPTSLDTQVRVTIRSRASRSMRSFQSISISRSTMPWMRNVQSEDLRVGTRSAVSMR